MRYLGTTNESGDLARQMDAGAAVGSAAPASPLLGKIWLDTGATTQPLLTSDFDVLSHPPSFTTFLDLAGTSVMQNMAKGEVTGEWFATQAYDETTNDGIATESTNLTRMTAQGVLLDYMTLQFAGHGTSFAMEQDPDGTTWITMAWARWPTGNTSANANDIVKFKYIPGATRTRDQSTYFTVENRFGGGYIIPMFDKANDLVAWRVSGPGSDNATWDTFQLRKLSEWRAGIDNVLAQAGPFQVTDGTTGHNYGVPQGWAIEGNHLYRYNGDSSQTNPNQILRYTWVMGSTVTTPDGAISTKNIGAEPVDQSIDDNFHEPEGMSIYRDKTSGAVSLFFGVVTGPMGQRRPRVWGIHQDGGERFIGEALRGLSTPRWEPIGASFGAEYRSLGTRYPVAFRVWPNGMVEWTGTIERFVNGPAFPTGVTDLINVPDRVAPAKVQYFACGASGPSQPLTRIAVTAAPNAKLQNGNGVSIDWVDLNGVRYDLNPDTL